MVSDADGDESHGRNKNPWNSQDLNLDLLGEKVPNIFSQMVVKNDGDESHPMGSNQYTHHKKRNPRETSDKPGTYINFL